MIKTNTKPTPALNRYIRAIVKTDIKPTPALNKYIRESKKRKNLFCLFKKEVDKQYWDLSNFMRYETEKDLSKIHSDPSRVIQQITAENYKSCQLLIYRLTHNAATQFHIPFEEVLGQANFAFVQASYRYKNKNIKLSSWISLLISKSLQDWCKINYKGYNTELLEDEMFGSVEHNSFLVTFKDELNDDGRFVVDLIFTMLNNKRTDIKSKSYIVTVRKQLRKAGWAFPRIEKAIANVKTQLFCENRT